METQINDGWTFRTWLSRLRPTNFPLRRDQGEVFHIESEFVKIVSARHDRLPTDVDILGLVVWLRSRQLGGGNPRGGRSRRACP